MGILDDVTNAVITYPRDYLEVEIINVNPPGSELNVGEDALFTFQVANNGPLDVKDLTLKVEGLNGTTVKANGAAAQWEPSHTSRVGYFPTVPAHSNGPNDPGPVVAPGIEWHFKPATSSSSVRDLVRVSVAGWTTDFEHMFRNHSQADAEANATYRSTVSPPPTSQD